MKKLNLCLWTLVATVVLAFTGCKQDGSLDTAKVTSAFSSAEGSLKSEADAAVAAVKSGDYSGALTKLQALAANVKLTPEQQQSIKDLLAQVQTKVTGAAQDAVKSASDAVKSAGEKTGDAANKAATDLQKSINK